MSANVNPTYKDTSEAMSRAAHKAIVKPLKVADVTSKPAKTIPAKALQEQLELEFSGHETADNAVPSTQQNIAQQVMMIAVIVGATWVLGFALYANL